MSLQMKQNVRMSQQMVMTPHLQMSLRLLQISRMELLEEVQEELKENPLLEDSVESDEPAAAPADPPRTAEAEVPSDGRVAGEVDWETYLENAATASAAPSYHGSAEEAPSIEQASAPRTSLSEHLLQQMKMAGWTCAEERVGFLVVNNLDGDGYLKDPPLSEIAEEAEVPLEVAERVLRRIQRLDPPGCAARGLSEGLLCQAAARGIDDEVLVQMLTTYLPDLEKRRFARIARKLGVDLDEVLQAAEDIQGLDPRPGRAYSSEEPRYIIPDVYVHKVGDAFFVQANDDGLPRLRVSSYYLAALRQRGSAEAREYVKERLRSATWLIGSLQQRQRTLIRVTESILRFQGEFFDKGPRYLRPMCLRDVAQDLGLHESTVSRATSNKYVHTPQGLFDLKYFFDSGLTREEGREDVAAEVVKRMIKDMVGSEAPRRPYWDQKIAELLRDKHRVEIARRTVAKYREQLRILAAPQRRQAF